MQESCFDGVGGLGSALTALLLGQEDSWELRALRTTVSLSRVLTGQCLHQRGQHHLHFFLEMQILRHHPNPIESEPLGVRPESDFNKPSK